MRNMINVLIKDGNRTVNWDYFDDSYVQNLLDRHKFRPVNGTVRIGGLEPDKPLNKLKLSECVQEVSPDGYQMRVRITLVSVKPKPKKAEVKKEE
jgi:hypothetical protein